MADQAKMDAARGIYETLCSALERLKVKFTRSDEILRVDYTYKGDDLLMPFMFIVDPDREFVSLISPMSPRVKEDKRLDMAVALSLLNYRLAFGCFDLDMNDGELRFRMVNCYRGTPLSEEVFAMMLQTGHAIVEKYNDKLYTLAAGIISLEQFVTAVSEPRN
jgi:hypothetical protein